MSDSDKPSRGFRRKRKHATPSDLHAEIAANHAAKSRRYWPWIALAVFLIGLYLLPNLASSRTVRTWLVNSVSKDYPVEVTVDGASVGWFSPIILYGVHVADLQGEPLLDAEQIICRSSLSSLLFNSKAPGVVRVEQPVLLVRVTQNSSNWEQTLAQMPPVDSTEPMDLDAAVELVDGVVIIEDTLTGRSNRIERVSGRVDYPRGNYKPLTAKLSAALAGNEAQPPGQMSLEGEWLMPLPVAENTPPDPNAANWGSGQMAVTLTSVPLEVTTPFLRRSNVAVAAEGQLNGKLVASRAEQGGPLHVQLVGFTADQLKLVRPMLVAEPAIALEHTELAGTFRMEPQRMSWEGVRFTGDLGSFTSAGGVNLAGLANNNYEAAFAGYPQHMEGRVDITQLARVFPETLAIREDIRLQSGSATFHFDNGLVEHEGAGQVQQAHAGTAKKWAGAVHISDIEVVTAQGQVHRIPPAQLALKATTTSAGITVDQLDGQGEFFALRAQGNTSQGQIQGNVSLDKLQQELRHLIDLRGVQLAGQANVQATWSRDAQNQWNATSTTRMTDWKLTLPELGVWQEPNLIVAAQFTGVMVEGSLQQLNQGNFAITAGADIFTAKLERPVDLTAAAPQWPLSYSLQGDANRWQTRLAAFIPMAGTRVDGKIAATGLLSLGSTQLAWQDFKLHAEPLNVRTASMSVSEPLTDITSTGTYSFTTGSFAIEQLQLVSTSVSVQAENIQADFTPQQPVATGTLAFRGDWSRVSQWFITPTPDGQITPWRMEGTFEGNGTLAAQNDVIAGNLAITNRNTAFYQLEAPAGGTILASANVPKWRLAWQEPEAKVNGKLSYRPQAGLIQLENLSLLSNMLQVAVAGNVSDFGNRAVADIRGTMQYDLAKLSSFLQTQVGNDFQLTGVKKSEFYIRGPLNSDLKAVLLSANSSATTAQPMVSPQLEAAGGIAWEGANLYGLPVGASSLKAQLSQSVVLIDPIDLPLSQGRLKVNSKLFLFEPGAVLAVQKGRVVDNVEITPQMCHAWLKYVAPLVADVTRVQGRLALDLNDSQIPLANPQLSNTSGALVVSNAQVGPGPLSEVFIILANRVQSLASGNPAGVLNTQAMVWVNVPQQQIPFAVREERVFHEHMTMNIGSVQVTTTGSVGFDQSLQLLAEIPIRSEWFQNKQSVLASLQGQKLQIPVTGTITSPQIDSRVLEQIARQGIQGAANDLINEGIRRGLGRLLGPAPQQ